MKKKTVVKPASKIAGRKIRQAIVDELPTLSFPWRPRAKTKIEKAALALRSHSRRERSDQPCDRAPLCKKRALAGDTLCSMHAGARDNMPNGSLLSYSVAGAR